MNIHCLAVGWCGSLYASAIIISRRTCDKKTNMKILLLSVLLCLFGSSVALDNGLGRTPQMGWSSWNHFRCNFNQTLVEKIADAFINLGLDKLGYEYVNVDGCWAKSRDSNNVIQVDTDKFPDWQGLINYVHNKGLKFGFYSDAGTLTCLKKPGSLGYEDIDARTYANWTVDYLKYDNCYSGPTSPQKRYAAMRDALNKTGRPIYYAMCEWGIDDPATWASSVGNSWRTTGDIQNNWSSMISRADQNDKWAKYAGPGGWNDPDMLEVGNGLTVAESETHFSLWCLMKAPLLIGCDLTNIDNESLRVLTNKELIAVNQDKLGIQGNKKKSDETLEVWAGPLDGGAYAVVLLNRGTATANVTAEWTDIGLDSSREASVRDLWKLQDLGTMKGSMTAVVVSHGVAVYKITPTS